MWAPHLGGPVVPSWRVLSAFSMHWGPWKGLEQGIMQSLGITGGSKAVRKLVQWFRGKMGTQNRDSAGLGGEE